MVLKEVEMTANFRIFLVVMSERERRSVSWVFAGLCISVEIEV